MKMKGKRILTALLAMMMLFALLPGGAAATEAVSNITVKYDFKAALGRYEQANGLSGNMEGSSGASLAAVFPWANSNGFFAFAAGSKTALDGNWIKDNWGDLQLRNSQWISFEIHVPEDGEYTFVQDVKGSTNNKYYGAKVYIKQTAPAADDFGTLVGNYDDYNAETSGSNEGEKTLNTTPIALTKGKWYITYSLKDQTSEQYAFVKAVKLISGDGTGSALMGTVTAEASKIDVGKSTKVTVKGYGSATATELSGVTYTYSSTNEDVATVDKEGNVTAVAPGTATIQAMASGYAGALTAEITVPAPYDTDVTVKYDFAGVMRAYENANGYNYSENKLKGNLNEVFSEANAHGFFSYSVASQTNIGDDEIKSNYGDLQIKNGHWLTFEINVPVKGNYTFTQNFKASSQWTATANVYITKNKPSGLSDLTEKDLIGTYNCSTDGTHGSYTDKVLNDTAKQMDAGKWYVTYSATTAAQTFINYLSLSSGNGGSVLMGNLSTDKAEITVGETATVTGGYDSATAAAASGVTYNSLNTDIATVNENTVTAVAPGTATIQATAEGYEGVLTTQVTVKAPEASIDSHSVKLDGILGMNIYVQDIPKDTAGSYKILFTVDGNAAQELTGTLQQDGRYCFTGKVCASEMSKKLKVQLYKASEVIEEKEYTVKTYLENLKEHNIETLTALAGALLTYGDHAAYIKGYATTAPTVPAAPDLEGYTYTGSGIGVKLSAFIDDACDFRISFPDSYGNYTLSVDGADKGLISSLNNQYSIDEIPGEFWGVQHTFKVMNGNQEIYNQSRSVMNYLANYIKNHADDTNETATVNLMKAMWHYSTAAVAYKTYLQQ